MASVIVVTSHAVAWEVYEHTQRLSDTLTLSTLVALPVALVAAILLGMQWRLTQSSAAGWLGLLLGAVVVHGFGTALARVPAGADSASARITAVDLAVGVGLLITVLTAARGTWPRLGGPALVVALPAVGLVALQWPDAARFAPLVVLVCGAATAIVVRRQLTPPWLGRRAAVALVALSTARAVVELSSHWAEVMILALALGLLGSLLLCDTALVLLLAALREEATMLRGLHDRLESSVSAHRGDQERLHEISGTVAGIASATQLIERRDAVTPEIRHRMEDMLAAETARLVRLLAHTRDDGHEATVAIDLDTLIGRLVAGQEACGRRVRWSPSGLCVRGRPDEVTEVLHILLENAAVHAPGCVATVEVRRCGRTVEVSVTDSGPGVPAAVVAGLFDWGARGPDSPGHGIGLHVAHRLSDANGGHLRHVPSPAGATFVVDLELDVAAS
ncbi:sensor histidine kinase [Nocardioides marinquilinus]|uniref:sensor histidine kinase n=1 Tax=Nocardioides marinquilinus TaxID=1210400 RepID=UPI0031EA8C0E